MSIDARVKSVHFYENGGGELILEGRKPGEKPGQPKLLFDWHPEEVSALNGCEIWGGANSIMLGDKEIAKRIGYTQIRLCDRAAFCEAIKEYNAASVAGRSER